RAITATSPIRGTLVSTHSSSVSRHAASSGRAAFLLPSTATAPWSRAPPSIRRVDIGRSQQGINGRVVVEADEDRFRPQTDRETLFDGALHGRRETDDIRGGSPATIHERERMLAREAHGSVHVAFREPGALNQPRRGNLDSAVIH